MKKITFLFLLCGYINYAQYIVNTTYTDTGNHFVYNGNLLFSGNVGGTAPVFAKYDGVTATAVENPSGFTNVYSGFPISYNSDFYFKASPGNLLGKYNGTSVSYVDKVNPSDNGLNSYPVIYNSKLTYIYRNNTNLRYLATYDGTTQTIYPNPDASTQGFVYVLSEYNGEQCFGYINQDGRIAIAKFNGTSISLVPNLNSTDWGVYSQNACIVNNVLVFLYQTSDGKIHFAKYDGTNLTVEPNLLPADDIAFSSLFIYNGYVYARYLNSTTGKYHLAKYDGTTISLIPNIALADSGISDGYFIYNNKLYIRYINASSFFNLVRTDGTTLELMPFKYVGGNGNPDGYALKVGSDVYFRTETGSGFLTLGKYDGTNFTAYQNAGNTDPFLGQNNLVFFNNKIHFVANNGVNDKLSYLDVVLSKDDFNKNTFKIYPNPSNGIINIKTEVENIGAKVEVSNILGQKIKSFELNQIENQVTLDKGMYFLTITKDNNKSSHKVIIE